MNVPTIKVLLIEDEPAAADLYREMLRVEETARFEVKWADSLKKALGALLDTKPDVILLDLTLTDSKGLHTLASVHAQAGEIPIIILTGVVDETTALSALRQGAQEYLLKGEIHGKMLARVIRYAIERKRSEEKLGQLQVAINSSMDGIAIVNEQGEFLYVNEAMKKMFGYDEAQDLVGKSWKALYEDGQTHPVEKESLPQLLEKGQWRGEMTGKKSDGRTFPLEVSVNRMEGDGFVCVHRDVSVHHEMDERLRSEKLEKERLAEELQQALAQLKQKEEQIIQRERSTASGEFAAAVVHEIRNPLSIISMAVQYLQSKFNSRDPCREFSEAIIRKVQRLDSITKRLTAYGQPIELNSAPRNLHRCLNRSVTLLKIKCKSQGIKIERRYSSKIPLVMIDEGVLDEVLTNLLTNALEAMPKGGWLTLETDYDPETDQAILRISDTGRGIKPDHRQYLFKPFFSTKKDSGGTGLGLAISHRIVTEHGGTMAVQSTTRGLKHGTTFVIRLPVRETQDPRPKTQDPRPKTQDPRPKTRGPPIVHNEKTSDSDH